MMNIKIVTHDDCDPRFSIRFYFFLIVAHLFVFSALKKRTEGLIFCGQSQAIVPWRFSFTPVSFCLFAKWLKADIFPVRFHVWLFSSSHHVSLLERHILSKLQETRGRGDLWVTTED